MSQRQIIGICILVVGVILLYFGYNATQSVGEEMAETFTGRYSDETTWYLILGAVGVIAGLLIAVTGKR